MKVADIEAVSKRTWGQAAKGLGPRAVQGGVGGWAVDTVLVPYIAALRAEGFRLAR